MRVPAFSPWYVVALAVAFSALPSGAGELDPLPEAECKQGFSARWEREFKVAREKISAWKDGVRTFQEEKQRLTEARIFWGLGPKASSVDARMAAEALHGIKIGANAIRRSVEIFVPEKQFASRALEAISGVDNVITQQRDGTSEWLRGFAADLNPVTQVTNALYDTVNEFREAMAVGPEWDEYRKTLREQVERVDREIEKLNQRIEDEETRVRERSRQRFELSCVDSATANMDADLERLLGEANSRATRLRGAGSDHVDPTALERAVSGFQRDADAISRQGNDAAANAAASALERAVKSLQTSTSPPTVRGGTNFSEGDCQTTLAQIRAIDNGIAQTNVAYKEHQDYYALLLRQRQLNVDAAKQLCGPSVTITSPPQPMNRVIRGSSSTPDPTSGYRPKRNGL